MNKKKTIILLVIGILVFIISSIGVTYSYMKPKTDKTNNKTEIGINNCAKITLKDNDSTINLINMYPMEEEMGLKTIPYEFTISSTCEEYTGFNLYLTTLSDNQIKDKDIRYAVTDVDDNVLITDLLKNKEEANDLTGEEIKELEQGLENKRNKTYKVYNGVIPLNKDKVYKLHLWLDENANNDTMNQSFKIKVSIKGYKYEGTLAEYLIKTKDRTLIYHNGLPDYKEMENYELEAGDLSYRFAGGNDVVNNYVCFGTDTEKCPEDNLYRIIGLFQNEEGMYESKLVMANAATNTQLGNIGLENETNNQYMWNNEEDTNWVNSQLNKENLNNYFINNYLTTDWTDMITMNNWYITKVTFGNALGNNSKIVYDYEIGKNKPELERLRAKVALMYLSDYMYMANSKYWSSVLYTEQNYPDYNGNYGPEYDYRIVKSNNSIWFTTNYWTWLLTINYKATNNTSYGINAVGEVTTGGVIATNVVYPCFYLSNLTKLLNGNGTKDNPYRISI